MRTIYTRIFIILGILSTPPAKAQITPPSWINAIAAGGGQFENGGGIRAGNNNKIYVGGRYANTISLSGLNPGASGGATSDFSAQLSNNLSGAGNWATRVQVSGGYDYVFGYNIDVNNNTYTVGTVNSGQSFYVSKTNSLGVLQWNLKPGSSCGANGVCADAAGNVYVAGGHGTTVNLGTGNLTYAGGGSDFFLVKYSSAGVPIWSVRGGGVGYDAARACVLDMQGNIWVCGGYTGTPTFGSFTLPASGSYSNLFVAQFNPTTGACMAAYSATNAGIIANGWYEENDLVIDSCNNIYVTGHFQGTATWGSFTKNSAGSDDFFVAKLKPTGQWQWVQTGGGTGPDQGQGVVIDKNWDVCVSGYFRGTASFSGTNITANGPQDAFVAKYASGNGALMCVQKGGGAAYEDSYGGLTVDNNRQVYLTGGYSQGTSSFGMSNLPVDYYGDIYVAKLDSTPSYKIVPQAAATYCAGQCYTLPLSIFGTFNGGNIFTVELSDANGSFASGTATIGTLNGTSSGTVNICIPANATAGSNYLIRVTSTNPVYCSAVKCTPLTISGAPTLTLSSGATICNGSNTTLSVSGANTYSWSPATGLSSTTGSSVTANPSTSTTYIVTGTNSGGCNSTASVSVTVNPQPTAVITGNINICPGTSTTLSVSGSYTYSWSTGSTNTSITVNPTATTTYSVSYTNGNCTNTSTVLVTVSNISNASIFSVNQVGCFGSANGSASVSMTGGTNPYTYAWNNGQTNSTATGLGAGVYTVTVTDNGGCSATQTVTITQPAQLAAAAAVGSNVSCNGGNNGSASVNGSGGSGSYTYSWSNGATTSSIINLTSNIYSVTITDANGCTATATATVTQPTALTLALNAVSAPCSVNGGTASSTVTGGTGSYTYSWSNGQNTASANNLAGGTYTLTVTDAKGCTKAQMVTVATVVQLTATTSSTPTGCATNNGTATVNPNGGTGPYTYSWSNGQGMQTANMLGMGSYSVLVTDSKGCTYNTSITVGQTGGPTANAGMGATITQGNSILLNGNGGGTYSWSPANGLSCANCQNPTARPTVTTTYKLTVTDVNGCTSTDEVTVLVDVLCGTNVLSTLLPNAFSPNRDGRNDHLCVPENLCVTSFDLKIYDRWGEKVFETNSIMNCWDGEYKGQALNTAVFVYYYQATLANGETFTQKGNISLIR